MKVFGKKDESADAEHKECNIAVLKKGARIPWSKFRLRIIVHIDGAPIGAF